MEWHHNNSISTYQLCSYHTEGVFVVQKPLSPSLELKQPQTEAELVPEASAVPQKKTFESSEEQMSRGSYEFPKKLTIKRGKGKSKRNRIFFCFLIKRVTKNTLLHTHQSQTHSLCHDMLHPVHCWPLCLHWLRQATGSNYTKRLRSDWLKVKFR